MASKYKELWFRGLDAKDKESLERALDSSILARRLAAILEDWSREHVVTKGDYDCPSWSHKQAHLNGIEEILTRMKSLLTPDQRK